jgi:hypothetical protein
MGFQLGERATPPVPAGQAQASFDAPVVDGDAPDAGYGTARLAVDGVTAEQEAVTVTGAFPGTDLVYVLLFDDDAPGTLVLVATRTPLVTPGAVLPLDNQQAAALVVDELTGACRVVVDGSVTLAGADLAPGGHVVGIMEGSLAQVTLEAWPEGLFPFTTSGDPAPRATVTGGGTFTAPVLTGEEGEQPMLGAADVPVEVEGYTAFRATAAYAYNLQPEQDLTVVVLLPEVQEVALVLALSTNALVQGATTALGGNDANAWVVFADGTQVAVTAGSVSLTGARESVAGSVVLSGQGIVLTCEEPGCGAEEPVPAECERAEEALGSFQPSEATLAYAGPSDGLPPGYGRAVMLYDVATGWALVSLLADGVALTHGTTLDLAAQVAGQPAAFVFHGTCSVGFTLDRGTLTLDPLQDDDARLSGTLLFHAAGTSRQTGFDVPLSWENAAP